MSAVAEAWIEAQAPLRADPAEWRGEVEPDPDPGFEAWAGIRTKPTAEEAAELRRRHSPGELLELSRDPVQWNLALAAIKAGPAILEAHRNAPRHPPEPSREEVHKELRRQAQRVLKAPPGRRPGLLSAARRDLEAWRGCVISGAEIGEWVDHVAARIEGQAYA